MEESNEATFATSFGTSASERSHFTRSAPNDRTGNVYSPSIPQCDSQPTNPAGPGSYDGWDSVGNSPSMLTPSWLMPLQLVDDEKSIYMNRHGEDWKDHPLCLHCFRQHQNFHRVLRDGCEVCGRDKILKSYYWEVPECL